MSPSNAKINIHPEITEIVDFDNNGGNFEVKLVQ